jgi:hypothetical protein
MFFMPSPTAATNQGFSATTSYVASTNNNFTPANSQSNPYPSGVVQPTGSSLGVNTFLGQNISFVDPRKAMPELYQYTGSVETQLPGQMTLEVGYHGNVARALGVSKNINAVPAANLTLTTLVPNPMAGHLPTNSGLNSTMIAQKLLTVPYPEFGSITESTTYGGGSSRLGSMSYNSLQATLSKRISHGLEFRAAFTLAKVIYATSYLNDQDPFSKPYRQEDSQPNRFLALSTLYAIPELRVNRIVGSVVNGWKVNTTLVWQNGAMAPNPGGAFSTGITPTTNHQSSSHYFNTCYIGTDGAQHNCQFGEPPAWIQQPGNTLNQLAGNMRNVRIPQIPLFNASIFKGVPVYEGVKGEIRADFYNAFNNVVFGTNPNTSLTSSSFGVITTAQSNDPRIIELAFKISF